jgi:hypothetical protein
LLTNEKGIRASNGLLSSATTNNNIRLNSSELLVLKTPSKISHPSISLEAVSPNNFMRAVGGTGADGYDDVGGPASSARIRTYGLWVDNNGVLYITDGSRINKIDTAGNLVGFAGSASQSTAGTSGPVSSISMYVPYSIVGDSAGTFLYFSDLFHVWKYTVSTNIASVYVSGANFDGDGLPVGSAHVNQPQGLWLTTGNVLYIADSSNRRIRKVVSDIISTVAGSACSSPCGGGTSVPALSATFNSPVGLFMDTNGYLYIADMLDYRVRRLSPGNIITNFAGSGTAAPFNGDNIPAGTANINSPRDVKGDSIGNIYITDHDNCLVRVVDTGGILSTLFGTPNSCGYSPGIASRSSIIGPTFCMWVDSASTLYFTDYNSIHRRIIVSSPTSQPSGQPTYQPTYSLDIPLKVGLVARYPFDGNAIDETGGGSSGLLRGGVNFVNDRFGKGSSAVNFDGTSGFVELPGGQFNFVYNMSLSLWVYPFLPQPTTSCNFLLDKTHYSGNYGSGSFTNGWNLRTDTANQVSFGFPTSSGTAEATDAIAMVSNTWNHIAFVKKYNKIYRYLNGNHHSTYSMTASAMTGNGNLPLLVGAINTGSTTSATNIACFFKGSVDELLIYNRPLTANDVLQLYTFHSPTSQPSTQPSSQPSTQPTSRPSSQPVSFPTTHPSDQPSSKPSSQPSVHPSVQPTNQPSVKPSSQPSGRPTGQPSSQPSSHPSQQPSNRPTHQPSSHPTVQPSSHPTRQPTSIPSSQPSFLPSSLPSRQPTGQPSSQPSRHPSGQPTSQPSNRPSMQPTSQPSIPPSRQPSGQPSSQPSSRPSTQPSKQPTVQPSNQPTNQPSRQPTRTPSVQPSSLPTVQPSNQPSGQPSVFPTSQPSSQPTVEPTRQPSNQPTAVPSRQPSSCPTAQPTSRPSSFPSSQPSNQPSSFPSCQPSSVPSVQPTSSPTHQPSRCPTSQPTATPSFQPTIQPTGRPTGFPSSQPSGIPSSQPTVVPSCQPTAQPSSNPSVQPSSLPSSQPSGLPTVQPSQQPSTQPTGLPSSQPSSSPSMQPTGVPSIQPSIKPSSQPTGFPTAQPSSLPSSLPSTQPTSNPTCQPSEDPSSQPTTAPSSQPTTSPSNQPSSRPSSPPSSQPSHSPSRQPISSPSSIPSSQPTIIPTVQPFAFPTSAPVATIYQTNGVLFWMGTSSSSSSSENAEMNQISNSVDDEGEEILGSSYILFGRNFNHQTKFPFAIALDSSSSYEFVYKINRKNEGARGGIRRDITTRSSTVIGDINGDSHLDFLIGYPLASKCSVYLGNGGDNFNSIVTTTGESFEIVGDPYDGGGLLGWSSVRIGDLNGDGFDEIVVSAIYASTIYVLYGKGEFTQNSIKLKELQPGNGFRIIGRSGETNFGIALALLHDFRKGSRSDLAITAQRPSDAQNVIYILFGSVLLNDKNIADIHIDRIMNNASVCFRIISPLFSYAGFSIAGIGDINRDGYDDLAIGSVPYFRGRYAEQVTYVVYGRPVNPLGRQNELQLSEMTERDGFIVTGGGFLVAGVDDVNGDGNADLMITNYQEWQGKGNGYPLVYPRNISIPVISPPSSQPSSVPSSFPTEHPSLEIHPPTNLPTTEEDALHKPVATGGGTFPPLLQRTESPSRSPKTSRPTRIPSFKPSSRSPTIKQTDSPSLSPSTIPTKSFQTAFPTTTKRPSNSPTDRPVSSNYPTSSPSITPTVSFASESSKEITIDRGGVYKVPNGKGNFVISGEGSFEINGKGSGGGKKIYTILPSKNTITITGFYSKYDQISLIHFPHLLSINDLAYKTTPLQILLSREQKLILSDLDVDDLIEENFIFRKDSEHGKTQLHLELSTIISLGILLGCLGIFGCVAQLNNDDGNKNKDMETNYKEEREDNGDDLYEVIVAAGGNEGRQNEYPQNEKHSSESGSLVFSSSGSELEDATHGESEDSILMDSENGTIDDWNLLSSLKSIFSSANGDSSLGEDNEEHLRGNELENDFHFIRDLLEARNANINVDDETEDSDVDDYTLDSEEIV